MTSVRLRCFRIRQLLWGYIRQLLWILQPFSRLVYRYNSLVYYRCTIAQRSVWPKTKIEIPQFRISHNSSVFLSVSEHPQRLLSNRKSSQNTKTPQKIFAFGENLINSIVLIKNRSYSNLNLTMCASVPLAPSCKNHFETCFHIQRVF